MNCFMFITYSLGNTSTGAEIKQYDAYPLTFWYTSTVVDFLRELCQRSNLRQLFLERSMSHIFKIPMAYHIISVC